jgi:NAD(P)-dependent dehydrogenase (short-subunit alcohol dehydrogenase family)
MIKYFYFANTINTNDLYMLFKLIINLCKGNHMRIIIIGATGTIGQAVTKELAQRHDIIPVSYQHSDITVDISNNESIIKMYQAVGPFDAVIATTGKVHFGALTEMTAEQYNLGLQNKLMGQVNLVLQGLSYINPHGSFTLTSGILNHDPIRLGSSAAMVNGALDGFVKSAALEMPKHVRINAVSPTVLTESLDKYGAAFRGFVSVAASDVALAFSKSVEGAQTGQIYPAGYAR